MSFKKGIYHLNIGEKNHNWKGGIRKTNGYIAVYSPNHPHKNKRKEVFEHRLVMEKKIGRYLLPKEEVDHINHVRDDNRIENLRLFISKKEHVTMHKKEEYKNRKTDSKGRLL